MFWIIESKYQIDYLKKQQYKQVFVEIIPFNNLIHPKLNNISLLYFHPINEEKGYMLCLNHNDTFSLEINDVEELLNKQEKIWVRDKKNFLYYFPLKNLYDVNIIKKIETQTPPLFSYYYNKFSNLSYVNKIIPLVKHHEHCETIYKEIVNIVNKPIPNYFDFYNNKVCLAFFAIEQNGIKIDEKLFKNHFPNINDKFSIDVNKIYTHYNLDTTTKRPSNSFNNVNFSALKKETGEKQCFIPENDFFVEIDCSYYHPSLVGKLVNYNFTKPAYEELADLMNINVDTAKKTFFGVMYGGKNINSLKTEFFIKLKEYAINNYETFNNSGEVIVPISSYCLKKDELTDMNPYKLLSYFIQNIETSVNTKIILKMIKLLKGKKTKLVLYNYDSFLLDVDKDEIDLILKIKQNIFEKMNINVKMKRGINYDFTKSN